MAKTTKTRVSNPKNFIGETYTGDKCTGIKPAICFYELEDDDKYDSEYESVIHVKIDKASKATKQTTKKMNFPVIKYPYHQVSKVIRMLHNMTVSILEHLGITTWKGIEYR